MGASRRDVSRTTGLEKLAAAFVGARYLIPALALFFFIVPQVMTRVFETGPTALAFLLAAAGFFPAWHYQRHPRSVRALISMHDGFLLGIGPLLTLGIAYMAGASAMNYWLYRDYLYFYLLGFSIVFSYWILAPSKLAKAKAQMEVLATYADRGITDEELYAVMTMGKGAKEAIEHWGPQRFALIIGPIVIVFMLIGGLGGRDYVLYFCFLLVIPFAALLMAVSLQRRIYLWKCLGSRDVLVRAN